MKRLLSGRELELDPDHKEASEWAAEWSPNNFEADCCDRNKFRVYLGSVPHHPWNQSAARVFAQILIDDEEESRISILL